MAVSALRGLAVTPQNQVKIVQEGGLNPLVKLAGSTDVEIQREVGAALCNLSNSDDNKIEIAESGVIPALLYLSQSEDEEVSTHSCATLANLAEVVELHTHLIKEKGLDPILALSYVVFERSRELDVHSTTLLVLLYHSKFKS